MKKNNKLEIIGFTLFITGVLSFVSEKYFMIESLSTIYNYGNILLSLGVAIWALGYWRKEKTAKDETNL